MEENNKIEFLIMPEKLEWEKLTESYGKVVIYSLERGFATTLGNSLRRMLLFCIPGTAITSVNIEGVKHEFSSIPGVLEDVPQLIANLKQTIIKVHDEKDVRKELLLDVKGEGEVRAGDIKTDKDVEILNPRLHLATLSKGKSLKMSIWIERGKSYIQAKKISVADMPIGTIAVDALFSPVKKVDFKMENTRVGDRIDYEKLVLEIWTNGTITPDRALGYATEVLIKHYEFILNSLRKKDVKEEVEEEILKENKKEDKKGLLSKSLSEFDLSVRSMNCLKAGNIKTLG
ncbi:MAG: DNA-directed RNA polymerase subunit alpha, partial [Candidatus Ratteibacteria bacterium]|nr:DNA-directed RNA polymerase subunit alpha [Candidatus Ratteibacteria bacterium]